MEPASAHRLQDRPRDPQGRRADRRVRGFRDRLCHRRRQRLGPPGRRRNRPRRRAPLQRRRQRHALARRLFRGACREIRAKGGVIDTLFICTHFSTTGGPATMDTVSYSQLRQKLKARMDKVCDDRAPLLVTRQNGEPVVLMSLAEYESLEETLHLLSNPTNAERLLRSIAQAKAGQLAEHEIEE